MRDASTVTSARRTEHLENNLKYAARRTLADVFDFFGLGFGVALAGFPRVLGWGTTL